MGKPFRFLPLALIFSFLLQAEFIHTAEGSIANLDVVKQFAVLPKGHYDRQKAGEMLRQLAKVNLPLLQRYAQFGDHLHKVKLVAGPITAEPEYRKLANVVPRGWDKTGKTWRDVPGIGGNPVVVRIGYSKSRLEHNSVNLELHEFAHAIDREVLHDFSGQQAFRKVWQQEAGNLFPDDRYFRKYADEYFAEVFARCYFSAETRAEVKKKLPLTYRMLAEHGVI